MSARSAEYCLLLEDVISGARCGLLADYEIADLRDMLARVEQKILADMSEASE